MDLERALVLAASVYLVETAANWLGGLHELCWKRTSHYFFIDEALLYWTWMENEAAFYPAQFEMTLHFSLIEGCRYALV